MLDVSLEQMSVLNQDAARLMISVLDRSCRGSSYEIERLMDVWYGKRRSRSDRS